MDGGYEVMIQDFFLCFGKVVFFPFGLISGGELIEGGVDQGLEYQYLPLALSLSIYYYYS